MTNSDRITAIVGAGGAIGEAIARRLSDDRRLALLDRDAARLSTVAHRFPADTLRLAVDAADPAAVDDAFASIRGGGGLEALVVAVGTTSGGSIHQLSTDDWDTTIESNLTTVFHTLRAAVATMLEGRGGGPVCVIGSVHADAPQPGFPAYAAAKAGVAALVRQVAAEYGHAGIRVNLVTPGWTSTPHTRGRLDRRDGEHLIDATPLRQLVEASDLADAVAWLLSESSRRVTGAEIVVDAGAHLLGGATVLRTDYRTRLGLPPEV
ncbi:SDR family NAD(P)-dependent oxidoreductase [Agromyces sp. NPDC058104]|uniref:SDR family NAD(P)-dependent oxidoreductase n=1 Tax=Agromyces sp. NPDC058104 TaxID=3346342 RepID=UPI0036D96BCF